jgi:hypothetical protein
VPRPVELQLKAATLCDAKVCRCNIESASRWCELTCDGEDGDIEELS